MKNSVIVVQVEAWFEAEEGVHDKNLPPQYFKRFCTVLELRWGKGSIDQGQGDGLLEVHEPDGLIDSRTCTASAIVGRFPGTCEATTTEFFSSRNQNRKFSNSRNQNISSSPQHYKMLTPQRGGMKIKSPVR